MNDNELRDVLKDAYAAREGTPPSFQATITAAESRQPRTRAGVLGGLAAAVALVALVVQLLPSSEPLSDDQYLIAEAFMNSTSWSAPSDSLLPARQFDIYRDLPFTDRSTFSEEGTLL